MSNLLPSTALFMQCVASSIKQRAVNWFGSSDALLTTAITSGGNEPISSTLKPNPKLAIPLVRASADDIDFDLCNGSGFNKQLFKITLLLFVLFADCCWCWYVWWMIGSGANLTRCVDC